MSSYNHSAAVLLCLALACLSPTVASKKQRWLRSHMDHRLNAQDEGNPVDQDGGPPWSEAVGAPSYRIAPQRGQVSSAPYMAPAVPAVIRKHHHEVAAEFVPPTQATARLTEASSALSANLNRQAQLQRRVSHLGDESKSDAEVELSVQLMGNETGSMAMAGAFGDSWKDIRMFEFPFYAEHVMEEQHRLKRKEHALAAKLTVAQKNANLTKEEAQVAELGESVESVQREQGKELANMTGLPQEQVGITQVVVSGNVWELPSGQRGSVVLGSLVYFICGIFVAFLYRKARSRNPKIFTPEVPTDIYPSTKDFSFHIFGGLASPHTCVLAFCCPCLAWADNLDRKEVLSFWNAFFAFFGLMVLYVYTMKISLFFLIVLGVIYRQKLRAKYDIENGTANSVATDFLFWCFCQPCAIVQESLEDSVTRSGVGAP